MTEDVKKTKITVYHGDITTLEVDAIVNAANKTLSGGGGVDGAIHAAAGPELLKECKTLGGCQTGEAKITQGYNLPAKFVIHTVGPAYGSEDGMEDELLSNCYSNSLNLAKQNNVKTIAFPNISTGIFRYPKDEAVEIAFKTVGKWIEEHSDYVFSEIFFVSFTMPDYELNKNYFERIRES